MSGTKILVFGDVNGQILPLAQKIDAVSQKAGPFEMVICVGDFFGPSFVGGASVDLLKHDPLYKTTFHVPTYILQPSESQLNLSVPSGELCPNLINLGKSGIITTTSGIRIVYVSGHAEGAGKPPLAAKKDGDDGSSPLQKFETVDKLEAVNIIKRCTLAGMQTDILITHAWPFGIERNSSSDGIPLKFNYEHCSKLLTHVVTALKPRYHFCALKNVYFERLPFRHHQVLQAQASAPATRFVALAAFNNKTKQKFMYAFNILPASRMPRTELHKQPEGTTESPFASVGAGKPSDVEVSVSTAQQQPSFNSMHKGTSLTQLAGLVDDNVNTNTQFFFDMNASGDSNRRGGRSRGGRGGGIGKRTYDTEGNFGNAQSDRTNTKRGAFAPGNTESCWFCLRRPEVEKHLIVSIGEHCYLALAKGGLTSDHVMILPISHKQATTQFTDDEMLELNKFKQALRKCFSAVDGKSCVAFERNYRSSHAQIQVVPVPASISNLTIKQVAEQEARSAVNLEMVEVPANTDLRQVLQPNNPYFLLELPRPLVAGDAAAHDDIQCEQIFARIQGNFPFNFGREVLAEKDILDLPDKIDWKVCKVSVEEETEMTKNFRDKFRAYDFTLSG